MQSAAQVFPYCTCQRGSYMLAASPYTLSYYSTTPVGQDQNTFCFQLSTASAPAQQTAVEVSCFQALSQSLDKISIKTSTLHVHNCAQHRPASTPEAFHALPAPCCANKPAVGMLQET